MKIYVAEARNVENNFSILDVGRTPEEADKRLRLRLKTAYDETGLTEFESWMDQFVFEEPQEFTLD